MIEQGAPTGLNQEDADIENRAGIHGDIRCVECQHKAAQAGDDVPTRTSRARTSPVHLSLMMQSPD